MKRGTRWRDNNQEGGSLACLPTKKYKKALRPLICNCKGLFSPVFQKKKKENNARTNNQTNKKSCKVVLQVFLRGSESLFRYITELSVKRGEARFFPGIRLPSQISRNKHYKIKSVLLALSLFGARFNLLRKTMGEKNQVNKNEIQIQKT